MNDREVLQKLAPCHTNVTRRAYNVVGGPKMFDPVLLIVASREEHPNLLVPSERVPTLLRFVERARRAKVPSRLLVATTTLASDDATAELLRSSAVPVVRGDPTDRLDLVLRAAEMAGTDTAVLINAAGPLVEGESVDGALLRWTDELDFLDFRPAVGGRVSVVAFDALAAAWQKASLPSERASLDLFFKRNASSFRVARHFEGAWHNSGSVKEPPRSYLRS